jgi:hypothetical protein
MQLRPTISNFKESTHNTGTLLPPDGTTAARVISPLGATGTSEGSLANCAGSNTSPSILKSTICFDNKPKVWCVMGCHSVKVFDRGLLSGQPEAFDLSWKSGFGIAPVAARHRANVNSRTRPRQLKITLAMFMRNILCVVVDFWFPGRAV